MKTFFVIAILLLPAIFSQEISSQDNVPRFEDYYEKVGENLFRALYRIPGFFYIPPTPDYKQQTFQQWFEAEGLSFGPGAFAKLNEKDRILEIVQTPDQITIAEVLLIRPKMVHSIRISFDIYELSAADAGATLALAAGEPDHTKALAFIKTKVKSSEATHLRGASTTTMSGQIAKIGSTKGTIQRTDSDEKEPKGEILWGSFLELDPVTGSDGQIVDLNFKIDHDFAAPQVIKNNGKPEIIYNRTSIISMITGFSSFPYLVATWETPNSAEKIQILFVRSKTDAAGVVERVREAKLPAK